jgi:hypothetical protein
MALYTLNELLKKNISRFDIEYGGYLSNHMSHGLIALYKLNASSSRIESFYNNYAFVRTHVGKLEPMIPPDSNVHITDNNWKDWLGKKVNYMNLVDYFTNGLEDVSHSRTLVSQYYPILSKGLAGAALHGMIDLGYGLEVMNNTTIIEGLAYSVYCYYSMGDISNDPSETDLIQTLQKVQNDSRVQDIIRNEFTEDMGFQVKMRYMSTNHADLLQQYDLKLSEDDNLFSVLVEMWNSVVKAYASSNDDFFILHCVTGARAFQMIFSQLTNPVDQKLGLQYLWKTVVAAFICQGCPSIDESKWTINDPSEIPEWEPIIAKAIEEPADKHEDEHLIKLVFVCHANDTEIGENPLHRLVSARKVGLLPW